MRLADFERTDDGELSRFVTRVPDAGGTGEFELTLTGPRKLAARMFKGADVELTIDSTRDESWLKQEFEPVHKEHRQSMWELAGLEDVDRLLKPSPRRPDRDTSVFASTRPVSGDGTPFFFSVGGFFVPTGASLFFVGSWVLASFAVARPATGNQDLFLHLFSPSGPVVSSSRLGGTVADVVSFPVPLFPYVPVFRVFGVAAGVCSRLTAFGV